MDADVIVVGAGPTGLTLAVELCLAGVRPMVLERLPEIRDVPKAGGLSGQIVRLLRSRGLLERFEATGTGPLPPLRLPFGGVHVDFTSLPDPPLEIVPLPQPRLEGVLDELAKELGADIRRGRELVGLSQDDATVTADVRGPDGQLRLTARYLVGCDGAYSRVRDLAGIPFPGMTYPEVQRLGEVTMPDSVTVHENGDVEFAEIGRIPFGWTPNERGLFAIAAYKPGTLGIFTSEDETTDYDDEAPMTLAEFRDSVRRVFGEELPLGEPLRLTRFTFHARHVERYRDGRVLLAGDAAHLFPAPGVALNAGMIDAVNLAWKLAATIDGWAPDGLLDTYHDERHFAGERTMLHARAQVALRRGHDSAADALRELFLELAEDEQPLQRIGAFIAGNVRYPLPDPNEHPLTGTFAPDLGVAGLLRTARPVLLDLADRADLREITADWQDRVDIATTEADDRPADALLIRPDGYIAWAASVDEPADTAVPALRQALSRWFGAPLESTES
jgi:2-polyprenyl-6-methoxyphenol hydroxylase-like FAD-dependent oxidoreductase